MPTHLEPLHLYIFLSNFNRIIISFYQCPNWFTAKHNLCLLRLPLEQSDSECNWEVEILKPICIHKRMDFSFWSNIKRWFYFMNTYESMRQVEMGHQFKMFLKGTNHSISLYRLFVCRLLFIDLNKQIMVNKSKETKEIENYKIMLFTIL